MLKPNHMQHYTDSCWWEKAWKLHVRTCYWSSVNCAATRWTKLNDVKPMHLWRFTQNASSTWTFDSHKMQMTGQLIISFPSCSLMKAPCRLSASSAGMLTAWEQCTWVMFILGLFATGLHSSGSIRAVKKHEYAQNLGLYLKSFLIFIILFLYIYSTLSNYCYCKCALQIKPTYLLTFHY